MKKHFYLLNTISKTLTLTTRTNFSTRQFCSSSSTFTIKNVTKSNFESSLIDLRKHVRDADFIAIDLEMTGITSAPWRDSLEFDRFDIRYLKVKDSAEKFAVVQFGVCPFRWDSVKQSFIAHPYNFYVFPSQDIVGDDRSNEFLCQTSSLDFLAKYQFDFNLCINEGISYLSRMQEDAALRRIYSAHETELSGSACKSNKAGEKSLDKIADILFTVRMKERISEWHSGLSTVGNSRFKSQEGSNESNQKFETIFLGTRPALKLNGFSAHQLRLIQSVTQKHFKDLSFILWKDEKSLFQPLVVYTDSKSDRDSLLKEVAESLCKEAKMKIEAAVGFRRVIDLLSSEQKLIVGHNCFLDVAHVYNKFFGSLPMTVEEYVPLVHKYFPYMIDTKILLNTNAAFKLLLKKGGTALSKAFASLCPQIALGVKPSDSIYKQCVKVEVNVGDMRSSSWNSGAKHEAGYDAFMTGCIFSQACSQLGIDFENQSTPPNLASEEKLQKHINLLYLSWTSGDIVDMRSGRPVTYTPDPTDSKTRKPITAFENIALVWGFSSKLKTRDIRECLCKAFGLTSVLSVYNLDETAVFVQFSKPKFVSEFLDTIETLEKKNDPLSVVHPLLKLMDGGNTCVSSYEAYKEICSSPISKVTFADQANAVFLNWKKTRSLERKIEFEMKAETVLEEIKARSDEMPMEEPLETLYLAEAQVSK